MSKIVEDVSSDARHFSHPWPFWVFDNFFTTETYNKLIDLSKSDSYELVDSSDGTRIVTNPKNGIANKRCIRISDNSLYDELNNQIRSQLSKVLIPSDFDKLYVLCDLVQCDPLYAYHKHVDHKDKLITIVVYLHPIDGTGTVLYDSEDNQYEVSWKPNRAVMFLSNPNYLHSYSNKSNEPRLSLNIYLSKGKFKYVVYPK
jgi:hypothetical protein